MAEDDAPEVVEQDEPELSAEELRAALLESQRRERDANARAEAERVRLDNLIRSASPMQSAPQQATEAQLGAMPDPAVDPEEFQKWIDRRDAQRERRQRAELDARDNALTQKQAAADLWNRFSSKYPDYSKLHQLASVAFQQVIARYGNVIPSDFGEVDRLMSDVKSAMDEMRGVAPTTPANRTGGVSGGSGAPRPSKPSKAANEEPNVSLVDDILNWQIQNGYI